MSSFRRRQMLAAAVVAGGEVTPGSDGYIWLYYNVTDISQPTHIIGNLESLEATMIVDGVSVPTADYFQFSEIGEHLVKIKENYTMNYRFYNIKDLEKYYSPIQRTSIGYLNFLGAAGLKVFQSYGITSTNGVTFAGCSQLEYVEFDAIVTIPGPIFNRGNNITAVFGPNLTSVGSDLVADSYVSKTVFKSMTPPTIQANTFSSVSASFAIYVPYSSDHSILAAYQSAPNWSDLAARIHELNSDGTIPTT